MLNYYMSLSNRDNKTVTVINYTYSQHLSKNRKYIERNLLSKDTVFFAHNGVVRYTVHLRACPIFTEIAELAGLLKDLSWLSFNSKIHCHAAMSRHWYVE